MDKVRSREAIEKDILEYLQSHHLLTMATASKDGEPDATALEYANEGTRLLVSVRPGSRKMQNVLENPRVFYEIHDNTPIERAEVMKIKAIQATTTGEVIYPNYPEFDHAFEILATKFPVFRQMPKEKRIILKFTPIKIWFLNYAAGFFHRDELDFAHP